MTKDYLSLDGLTHFFTKLMNKFATKDELVNVQNNAITNEDIDEICGTVIHMGDEVKL